jgi:hypothetical protein
VDATAWVFERRDTYYVYRIQFENIKGKRENKRIIKAMTKEGCELVGNGYSKGGEFILIFDKKIESRDKWIDWARQLSYPLVELNSKMNPKPTKLGSYYISSLS